MTPTARHRHAQGFGQAVAIHFKYGANNTDCLYFEEFDSVQSSLRPCFCLTTLPGPTALPDDQPGVQINYEL